MKYRYMIMVSISLEEANKRNYTYPNIQTILFDLDNIASLDFVV